MKFLAASLLATLALSGVLALPARNPQDDAEILPSSVPRRSQSGDPDFRDFKGVIDTGSGYPFLQPNPPTFAYNLGFFDSFEDIFRRLRTRLFPVVADDSSSAGDSSEGSGGGFAFGLRPLTPLNTNDGKTTSTVKVVDGHKVEVNETVYGDSNSLFKVRVVNIRPVESGEQVEEGVINNQAPSVVPAPTTSAPSPRGSEFEPEELENERREPLEKQPADNEVRDIDGPQHKNNNNNKNYLPTDSDIVAESTEDRSYLLAAPIETMNEQEQRQTFSHLVVQEERVHEAQTIAHDDEEAEAEASHDRDGHNENLDDEPAQQNQMKERENFESSDDEEEEEAAEMGDTFNAEWETLAEDLAHGNDAANDLDNHIDVDVEVEQFVPVDLSNDIAVNAIAAANPDFPLNPDAESIEGLDVSQVRMLPKFEKMSLAQAPESISIRQPAK